MNAGQPPRTRNRWPVVNFRVMLWMILAPVAIPVLGALPGGWNWERPNFDVVPGSNIVIPYNPDLMRDAFSPWIDYASKNPAERCKGFLYARSKTRTDAGYLYTSPDGIHWSQKKPVADRSLGDNTLLF